MAENEKPVRFDVKLVPDKHRELKELAGELDISVADATRLAITRMLNQRGQLLGDAA